MDPERATTDRLDHAFAGSRAPKVIAVTSGKGGVGKTNVVANLAVALSRLGQRVMILDADLGLGNLDVLFGVTPAYTLEHVLLGQKSISEIIVLGPEGVKILPTSSGSVEMTRLTDEQKLILLSELDRLEQQIDIFLIDTAAGISSNVIYFNTVAQEIIVVATTEPTSVTNAYAMMKVLSRRHGEKRFSLLANMVRSEEEARELFKKLSMVADQFLGVGIHYLGAIPQDDYLRMAVHRQRTVVERYPGAQSSLRFMELAKEIIQWPMNAVPKGRLQFLWKAVIMHGLESSPAQAEDPK